MLVVFDWCFRDAIVVYGWFSIMQRLLVVCCAGFALVCGVLLYVGLHCLLRVGSFWCLVFFIAVVVYTFCAGLYVFGVLV